MNIETIKKEFPSLKDMPVCYFDSASTTQKPACVINAVSELYEKGNANVGRGTYVWAANTTAEVEKVRTKVARFLHAEEKDIFFTSGTTQSLHTIGLQWGLYNLQDGDEVLYSPFDHEANVLPWFHVQTLLKSFGKSITLIPYTMTKDGRIDMEDLHAKITPRTRLISLTHVHNVFGYRILTDTVRASIPESILISLDCAQSAGHIPLDVQKLGADFVSFSGHKMCAYSGIGVLWISKRVQEGSVALTTNLESGTQNIAGIISLGTALDFINEIGVERIAGYIRSLTQYLLKKLQKIEGVEFLPGIAYCSESIGYGIISIKVSGISSQDVGFILNEAGIYVRTGTHCNASTDMEDSIRISLHIYNTESEIDRLAELLQKIVNEK